MQKCLKLSALRQVLKTLPKSLRETYERILVNIDELYTEDAFRTLQWLCFSTHPILLSEMVEALVIDLTNNRFLPERRLPDPSDVLTICSSLVSVTTESRRDRDSGKTVSVEVLRLAHYSVKEYLMSDRIKGTLSRYYWMSKIPASISLTQSCLVYLLYLQRPNILTAESFHKYLLARYAAESWPWYYEDVIDDADRKPLDFLACKLVESQNGFDTWLKVFNPDKHWLQPTFEEYDKMNVSPLYCMSVLGVGGVCRRLLDMGADVNAQGGICGNALQAASAHGNKDIVQLLLDSEADINAQGGHFGSALQAASGGGHEAIVQLLLDNGAEVNAQGGEYVTASAFPIDKIDMTRGLVMSCQLTMT